MLHKLAFAALTALVFTIPWEGLTSVASFGTLTRVIGFVAIALGIASVVHKGRVALRKPSLFLVLMSFFVLWKVLSYFWSIHPEATLLRLLTFVQLLALVWLIWQLCRSDRESTVLMQSYIFGAYIVIIAMIMTFIGGGPRESWQFRYEVDGVNANEVAAIMAVGIPLAWYLIYSRRSSLLYWLNLLYLPLALFAIVLTATRGGFLGSLVALSVVPLTYKNLSFWRRMGLLALLGVAAAAFMASPGIISNVESNLARLSTTSAELAEGDLTFRRVIWQAGMQVFADHPIVGVGSGAFRPAVERVLSFPISSHNSFVSALVEDGIIGLLLFLFVLAAAVVPILSLPSPLRAVYVAMFLTVMVNNLFLNWDYNKNTWFVLALVTTQRTYTLMASKTASRRGLVPSLHAGVREQKPKLKEAKTI
jgi:O-antigen ligase